MNRARIGLLTIGVFVAASVACSDRQNETLLAGAFGDYLGQTPPGDSMKIFAEGIISFGLHEHHLSIAPDGMEMFYVVADRLRNHHTILQLKRDGDSWLVPRVAAFSGSYNDFAPTYSPDGQTLYFCSNRPVDSTSDDSTDTNIWRTERLGDDWSEPSVLPSPVNDESNEYNPTITNDHSIYFQDHDESGADIYYTHYDNGEYSPPAKVEGINSQYPEIGPYVTPDESALLFSSARPDGMGSLDFYASFRNEAGEWSSPINLGDGINTQSADAIISLSPDGRYLFFTNFTGLPANGLQGLSYSELIDALRSAQNGDGTIYWVSANVLQQVQKPTLSVGDTSH